MNKTNNCVYLKHVPTGIAVKCHVDRSRELNRFLARRELCDAVERQQTGQCASKAPRYPAHAQTEGQAQKAFFGAFPAASGRHKTCKQFP